MPNIEGYYKTEHQGFFQVEKSFLSQDQCDKLDRLFTKKEVRSAVFQMGALKSPGPDGFPALFYQRCWHFLQRDVVNAVLQVLNTGIVPKRWNQTYITLIPKCTNPEGVDNYRPISLCNVIMKIVTKCIANRVRGVINDLVGPFQNAFVPGRSITDNIIIAHEMVHKITATKGGKCALMGYKADMGKAYDRLDWNFIQLTLICMGFPTHLITLIMATITTVSYEILINGAPTASFTPKCGIRQGDPLSPYIFVMCTEFLSLNLLKSESVGTLKGISVSRSSMPISHLLFADDSIFFIKGDKQGCCSLDKILKKYCLASGQCINHSKSALLISPSSPLAFARKCMSLFKAPLSNSFGTYLGLPSDVSNSLEKVSKRTIFNFILEKVARRIASWNCHLLSAAGRLTLISSVLSSISIYFLSVFKIPISVTAKIDSMLSQFWWTGGRMGKHISWCSKLFLSQPKGKGGLGIRNARGFNQAMVAKLAWRMVSLPSSLLARTLGKKYKLLDSLKSPVSRTRPMGTTWGGRSILWGFELIREKCAWKVCSSSTLNVWTSKWVEGFAPLPKDHSLLEGSPSLIDLKIRNLIVNHVWNVPFICHIFDCVWATKILAIPIFDNAPDDTLYLEGTKTGNYTVKMGYHSAQSMIWTEEATSKDLTRLEPDYHDFVKKKLWTLPGPKVWHVLLWKILTDTLPVGQEFSARHILTYDTTCRLDDNCTPTETLDHLFRDCNFAQRLWAGSYIGIRAENCSFVSIKTWMINWLYFLLKMDDNKVGVISFLATLWTIWRVRNNNCFRESRINLVGAMMLYESQFNVATAAYQKTEEEIPPGTAFLGAFDEHDDYIQQLKAGTTIWVVGTMSSCDMATIHVDGSWEMSRKAGYGWSCSNSNGNITTHWISGYAQCPEQAEGKAILEAMKWALANNLLHISVHSDCITMLSHIAVGTSNSHLTWTTTKDIYDLASMFHCFSISYVNRSCNVLAHRLANWARA
ncbi:uncharacterized protein LOC141607973 [Silene latifolia]|uniref:uncharacterized protein LOC141607973 n=1 Tax=Silene latifolia TaxID=37657 RepID=UPI003D774656